MGAQMSTGGRVDLSSCDLTFEKRRKWQSRSRPSERKSNFDSAVTLDEREK